MATSGRVRWSSREALETRTTPARRDATDEHRDPIPDGPTAGLRAADRRSRRGALARSCSRPDPATSSAGRSTGTAWSWSIGRARSPTRRSASTWCRRPTPPIRSDSSSGARSAGSTSTCPAPPDRRDRSRRSSSRGPRGPPCPSRSSPIATAGTRITRSRSPSGSATAKRDRSSCRCTSLTRTGSAPRASRSGWISHRTGPASSRTTRGAGR